MNTHNTTHSTPRPTPRPVFAAGRISVLVNSGLLPESVLANTTAENAVVEYGRHDRRDDEKRRETR